VLGSYADRLASIVEDELGDAHFLSSSMDSIGNARPYNFGQVVELPHRKEGMTTPHTIQKPM